MPKFLFDLDETLYIGDVIKVAVQELKNEGHKLENLSGSDAEDFNFTNFPEVLRQRLFKLFADPIKACINKEPLPGAYAFLYYLQKNNHKLGFLTSRPATLKEASEYVLWRDFPEIEWSFKGFANNNTAHTDSLSKFDLIKKWEPDYYFDDYQGYCSEALLAKVPQVYLISNSHTGWNHSFVKTKPFRNIQIIKSILDLDVRSFRKELWEKNLDQIIQ